MVFVELFFVAHFMPYFVGQYGEPTKNHQEALFVANISIIISASFWGGGFGDRRVYCTMSPHLSENRLYRKMYAVPSSTSTLK
jgi:hypothetical protein